MFQMRKDENNGWALVLAANASKQKDVWNDVIKIIPNMGGKVGLRGWGLASTPQQGLG